ncbi:UDP-N-acetylmuramoyl-tripeptide--D-alanyl-D-alanine ligase, partial [Candidatus Poribacteria bacterium]
AVAKVEPVPHRLQLSAGAGGVTIIDDSFNANPVGAKAALEVLDDFGRAPNGGKKVLVTPGMVELGEQEYEENRRFGERAALVCDRVILVGRNRTAPILEGLKTANYPKDRVSIAANLAEVKDYLAKLLKPGDVVLFENDLPDNYNESSVSP